MTTLLEILILNLLQKPYALPATWKQSHDVPQISQARPQPVKLVQRFQNLPGRAFHLTHLTHLTPFQSPFHSGSAHLDASFGDNPILQDEIRGIAGRIASGNFKFQSVHRSHRPDSSPSCRCQVSSVCPRSSSRKIGGPRHRTILWHEHKQRSLPRSGIQQLMCHQSFKIFKS